MTAGSGQHGDNGLTIRLVGLGSGGVRIVDAVPGEGRDGLAKLLIDTDRLVLASTSRQNAILVGRRVTGGWGCGRDSRVGEDVIRAEMGNILDSIFPADAVFLVTCFGGGTGSAAARLIAAELGRAGIFRLLVAVEPFRFEGQDVVLAARRLTRMAAEQCDASLIVPNSLTARIFGEKAPLRTAIARTNASLVQAVRGLCSVLLSSGELRLGLGELKAILKGGVYGSIGVGRSAGSGRISKAFRLALTDSFVEPEHMEQAPTILVGICSGGDFSLEELRESCDEIREELGLQRVRLGAGRATGLGSQAAVTLVPVGFDPYAALGLAAAGPVADERAGPLGTFEKQAPTLFHGANLDIPTFIRELRRVPASGQPSTSPGPS